MSEQAFPNNANAILIVCNGCGAEWYFNEYQNDMRGYNRHAARTAWAMKQCEKCGGSLSHRVSWARGAR